eukprot:2253183-Pyramimonas_sp.AAC.1
MNRHSSLLLAALFLFLCRFLRLETKPLLLRDSVHDGCGSFSMLYKPTKTLCCSTWHTWS